MTIKEDTAAASEPLLKTRVMLEYLFNLICTIRSMFTWFLQNLTSFFTLLYFIFNALTVVMFHKAKSYSEGSEFRGVEIPAFLSVVDQKGVVHYKCFFEWLGGGSVFCMECGMCCVIP